MKIQGFSTFWHFLFICCASMYVRSLAWSLQLILMLLLPFVANRSQIKNKYLKVFNALVSNAVKYTGVKYLNLILILLLPFPFLSLHLCGMTKLIKMSFSSSISEDTRVRWECPCERIGIGDGL